MPSERWRWRRSTFCVYLLGGHCGPGRFPDGPGHSAQWQSWTSEPGLCSPKSMTLPVARICPRLHRNPPPGEAVQWVWEVHPQGWLLSGTPTSLTAATPWGSLQRCSCLRYPFIHTAALHTPDPLAFLSPGWMPHSPSSGAPASRPLAKW